MNPLLKRVSIIFIWLYLIATILFNILFVSYKMDHPQDFGSFLQAGLNAASGLNPYSSDGNLIFRVVIESLNLNVASPNLNPPISVLIFHGVAKLGTPETLSLIWRLFSIAFYIATIVFLEIYYKDKNKMVLRVLWAFSLAGFWHAIEVGQIYTPLVLLLAIAWAVKGQRDILAGILLGLVLAVKPNFFLLVIVLVVGGGYLRLVAASVATFAMVSVLPFFVYGAEIYTQWAGATAAYNGYALPNNSLVGLLVRFDHRDWGTLLSAALVVALLVFIWRKKIDADLLWGMGVSASLLCSPLAWDSYTLFLLPYFYSQRNWLTTEKIAAAIFTILFILPYFLFRLSFINYVIFGWTYGWGIALTLIAQVSKARSQQLKA